MVFEHPWVSPSSASSPRAEPEPVLAAAGAAFPAPLLLPMRGMVLAQETGCGEGCSPSLIRAEGPSLSSIPVERAALRGLSRAGGVVPQLPSSCLLKQRARHWVIPVA